MGPQIQNVLVTKPFPILLYPNLIKISYLIDITHLRLKMGLGVREGKERVILWITLVCQIFEK
jgi:hypothetical protein